MTRSLQVLVVAPAMPPTIGGAETIAEVLTLGLAGRADTVVHLLTSEPPRPVVVDALSRSGGTLTLVPSELGPKDGFVGWEWATFARAEAIHRVCSEQRIDVVHAMSHDTCLAAAAALAGTELERTPAIVATYSEMSTEDSAFGRARSAHVYRQPVDAMVHLSEFYRAVAARHGCATRRQIVAAAVDPRFFSPADAAAARARFELGADRFVLLCPSRFSRRKGQLDLLDALERLPPAVVERLVVVLAGSVNSASSAFLGQVRDRAGSSPADVRIVEVSRDQMPDMLAASDLVVLPSHVEGLGFSAVEAMAAGRPVLLTRVPGFTEVANADGQVAYTVAQDPATLARDLTQLIDSASLRAELAAAGRRRAESGFGVEPFIDEVTKVYRAVSAPAAEPETGAGEIVARPLRPTDAAALRTATLANMNWTGEERFTYRDIDTNPAFRHYFDFRPERGDFGVVAESDGLVVGIVWLLFLGGDDPGYGFVGEGVPELSVSVWPGYRGQGVGKLLMRRALAEARRRGLSRVSLSVEADNPSLHLYRQMGFQPAKDAADGTYAVEL